jgi:protease I
MNEKNSTTKKVAIIIAFKNFRDEEYFIPKEIFKNAGIEVKTISTETGTAVGAGGGDTEVDLTLEELNINDFDAVVFVGGPGAYKYIESESAHRIARETVKKGKILAAICIAPAILAKAGVLKGKNATVWSSVLDKGPIKLLEENGAQYQDKRVVRDGKIITANGPQAAEEFAKEILSALDEQ